MHSKVVMISRLFPGLVVVIPVFALAQSGERPDAAAAALQGWSLDELCGARTREDVQAELERREAFSRHELRAIREGEVRTGLSLRSLICVRGEPDIIREDVGHSRGDPLAAYIYLAEGSEGSVAYVSLNSPEQTVVHVVEHSDPVALVRDPNFQLLCRALGRCIFVDSSGNPNPGLRTENPGFSTDSNPFGTVRCGERLCGADVTDSL
jgi:hypothetical protein